MTTPFQRKKWLREQFNIVPEQDYACDFPTVLPNQSLSPIDLSSEIDIVITWVDRNDPTWRKRYETTMGEPPGQARYENNDELELCLKSVCAYMPWIRHIYVVTECELPSYAKEISKVKAIHQDEIMDPNVAALPSFNSNAVESFFHRIPNLSEVFIFGNDDFMVGQPISKAYWFSDNLPRCSLRLYQPSPPIKDFWWYTFNVAKIIGDKLGTYPGLDHHLFVHTHQFSILRKSSLEKAWEMFADELSLMCQSRNRQPHHTQVTSHLFAQLVGAYTGTIKIEPEIRNDGLFDPGKYLGNNHPAFATPLWFSDTLHSTPDFYCVNQLSTPEDQQHFRDFKNLMLQKIEAFRSSTPISEDE
tara:strand:+ start:21 stop:1097 length:1077 start_codon:yes stop_codon:yes gene_type:complete